MSIRRIVWLCLVISFWLSLFTTVPSDKAVLNDEHQLSSPTPQVVTLPYIPSVPVQDEPAYTQTEIAMIEAVVMHEVGYCSRESKVAVTNVILNRLKDGRFGDSIYEVLHTKGQFDAIHNYYDCDIEPDDECRQAVLAALEGEDNSQGALYYCNMDYITNMDTRRWFNSLDLLFELDGQRFYK